MRRVDKDREMNEAFVPLSAFEEAYNRSLPLGFPRASDKALREFQLAYPLLFKKGDAWSIDKHRKRFMDWYSSRALKV